METYNHLIKSLISLKRPCADRLAGSAAKEHTHWRGKMAYVSTLNLMNHAKCSVGVAITIYFHRLAEDVKDMSGVCYDVWIFLAFKHQGNSIIEQICWINQLRNEVAWHIGGVLEMISVFKVHMHKSKQSSTSEYIQNLKDVLLKLQCVAEGRFLLFIVATL